MELLHPQPELEPPTTTGYIPLAVPGFSTMSDYILQAQRDRSTMKGLLPLWVSAHSMMDSLPLLGSDHPTEMGSLPLSVPGYPTMAGYSCPDYLVEAMAERRTLHNQDTALFLLLAVFHNFDSAAS
jgi:hypothetical protein